jgi:hypothetical protein
MNVEKVWGALYTLGARYLSKIRYIKYLFMREKKSQIFAILSSYLNVFWGIIKSFAPVL